MRWKFLYVSTIISLCAFTTSGYSAGSFLDWRPFIPRADLAPAGGVGKPSFQPPSSLFPKYYDDIIIQIEDIKTVDSKKEKEWNKFQFGVLSLSIYRYQNLYLKKDAIRSADETSLWKILQSSPSQFGNMPYRNTLGTMGKIFEPQFDLGIEF